MASKSSVRDLRDLLKKAEQERDAAQEALSRWEEKVRALLLSIEMMEAAVEQSEAEADSAPPAKEIRNVVASILREHGGPMHYGELHDLLVERGVEVKGKDPRRNLAAHLSNDDRFRSLGSGMWDLRQRGDSRYTIGNKWAVKGRSLTHPEEPPRNKQSDRLGPDSSSQELMGSGGSVHPRHIEVPRGAGRVRSAHDAHPIWNHDEAPGGSRQVGD